MSFAEKLLEGRINHFYIGIFSRKTYQTFFSTERFVTNTEYTLKGVKSLKFL